MSLRESAARCFRSFPVPAQTALCSARHPLAWRDRRKRRAALVPFLQTIDAYCGGFRGKRVLEVGSDSEGLLIQGIETRFGSAESIGVNPAFPARSFTSTCRLDSIDIRTTLFSDGAFDLIVSSSAFEHIQRFAEALQEMHRILAPNGYLYSHFGPIWSTSYGHHLWMSHRGRLFTYWNTILPPYCHLLMTQEAVALECERRFDAETSEAISTYVFSSPEQNQLFYEDYERITRASPFEVCFLKGYDHPELAALYLASGLNRFLDALHRKYPHAGHFLYDGITVLLRKRST